MNSLVVVPQMFEHDEAVIIGTAEALMDLALALMQAADHGKHITSTTFDPGDGEGYAVMVIPTEEPLATWYADDHDHGERSFYWNEFYDRVVRPAMRAEQGGPDVPA